jgi:hypothetical protein
MLAEAWADLELAVALKPDLSYLYHKRAEVRQAAGQHQYAEAEWQQCDRLQQLEIEALRPMGQRLTAVVFKANAMLYSPGNSDAFCFVLITFDPHWNSRPQRLAQLAGALADLCTKPPDSQLRDLVRMLRADPARKHRRRRLPAINLIGDAVIYYADLWVYRRFLPERKLVVRQLPVIAEPGDAGRMELLPPF